MKSKKLTWLLLMLFLVGVLPASAQSNQTYLASDGSFSFQFPVGWAVLEDVSGVVLVANDAAVMTKAPDQLVSGDVFIQIMSPPMTQSLLSSMLDAPPQTVMEMLLGQLADNFQQISDPMLLALPGREAWRVDVVVTDVSGNPVYDGLLLTVMVEDVGVALIMAFTRPDQRSIAVEPAETIAATLQFRFSPIDLTTLQPISFESARQLESLAILRGHPRWVRSLAFSPDGTRLASGDGNSNIRVWDLGAGQPAIVAQLERPFTAGPVFNAEGTQLLFGGGAGAVWLWDIETQTVTREYGPMSDVVWSVAYSPDNVLIAASSEDLTARIWNAESGEELMIFTGHRDGVTGVAFSPDGAKLATSSWDSTLRIWDIVSGQQLLEIEGPPRGLTSVAYSPDGAWVAGGARNGTARVWDAETGEELLVFQPAMETVEPVSAVEFSPDGRVLAVAGQDARVRLFDTEFGVELNTLEGPGWMNDIAFSSDGLMLAAANDAGVVLVWGAR